MPHKEITESTDSLELSIFLKKQPQNPVSGQLCQIAAIDTLIRHNFCLLCCQQPHDVKTGSGVENGKPYTILCCNALA